MGFNILFALALTAALAHAAVPRDEPPPMPKGDGQPIPGYDCSSHRVGNHNHPSECTRFISCTEGGHAYEMDCAECNDGDPRCPEGRTNYNYDADACLWPHEAGCSGGGGPPTTTTTTEGPTISTTEASEDRPIEGTPCDAKDADKCWTNGDCHTYWWCERDHSDHKGEGKPGTWKYGECNQDFNLYFNPHRANNSVHGGVCDHWTNLSDDLKEKYNEDPKCIDPHCEWRQLKECGTHYEYMHPKETDGHWWTLDCPNLSSNSMSSHDQLLWSQSQKNCLHCSEVEKEDGSRCCVVVD